VGTSSLLGQRGQKPLNIGDQVPALRVDHIIQYNRENFDLHTGRPLLLDFWGTWCGSCISSMGRVEKLHKELEGQFDVLMVTDEDRQTVEAFLKRSRKFGKPLPTFPIACNNEQLHKLFDFQKIPHYVWIDPSGRVTAFTAASELTKKNLTAFINNEPFDFILKKDLKKNSKRIEGPFVRSITDTIEKSCLFYSSFSTDDLDLPLVVSENWNGNSIVQIPNTSIFNLYRIAYGTLRDSRYIYRVPFRQVKLSVKDSIRYIPLYDGVRLLKGSLYTYRFVGPSMPDSQLKTHMRADLDKCFNLEAVLKKERVQCLVLRLKDSIKIAKADKEKTAIRGHGSSNYHYISNTWMQYFVFALAESFLHNAGYPIIDETHYKGLAYFEIEADMADWKSINKALQLYSLSLTLEEREMPVLYLNEKNINP
jgi:thiol-disulfide isomerase/thioredoxin